MTIAKTITILPGILLSLGLFASAAVGQVVPAKTWFSPHQPLTITNQGSEAVELVLTRFLGEQVDPAGPRPRLDPARAADLRELYPDMGMGTFVLYAVPPDGDQRAFVGTPLVIGVRSEALGGRPPEPMVIKVEPLRYAVMETEKGDMTAGFYYDVAPNTVANFQTLSEGGFFDGLSFHRIVPGFVIQGGDPMNNTEGGPGYAIDAEFNDRPHLAGVLSMAREGDPIERQGAMPRSEAANSAGSQFFIALDYATTRRLDGRYTVFGRLTDGMDVLATIGTVEIANPATGQPKEPQIIRRVRIEHVTARQNPYASLAELEASSREAGAPATRPATRP